MGIKKYASGCFGAAGMFAVATGLSPAWGQEPSPTTSPGAAAPPTALDSARAPAPAEAEQLATVVVHARRRDESSQDVPTAISTVSGNELDALGISEVQDFQQLLPSLNSAYGQARQSSLAIRGIGNNPANEGLEASVGIYLDNVFYGRPGMAVQDLIDVDQIDLLRGPQGTLFGKNTTAGVLNIQSHQPTFTPDSYVEVSGGERSYHQIRGVFSGPLGGHWAGRLVFAKTDDDGWVRNLHDGRELDSIHRYGARGQLLFSQDDFTLRLISDFAVEHDSQGSGVITGAGPARPYFRDLAEVEAKTGADASPTDFKLYETSIDGPQVARTGQGGASAEAGLKLGSYKLTSITAWRFWNFSPQNDADFTDAPIISNYGVSVRDRQWSQEIRLASPVGDPIDYIVGAYWFRQNVHNHLLAEFGPDADEGLLPTATPVATGTGAGTVYLPVDLADGGFQILSNSRSDSYGKTLTESYSLFAQGNWHITHSLEFTAGLRGTDEQKKGFAVREEPQAAMRYTVPPFSTVQNQQIGPWNSDDYGGLHLQNLSPSELATLSWKAATDQLVYATVSHGEKSGGFNINGVGSGPTLGIDSLKVSSERSTNFELGYKGSWLRHRIRTNLNLFDTHVDGYQAAENLTVSGQVLPVQVLTNVGKVESRGAEWDTRALLARGLLFNLNGAWDQAVYRSFDNAPCPAETNPQSPVSCTLTGARVQGAPRWVINAGPLYRFKWSDDLFQLLALNYAWRSQTNGSLDDSRYGKIPSYGLLNASTALRWGLGQDDESRGVLTVSIWAKNLLNEHYLLTAGPIVDAIYVGAPGTPRTVGASLNYAFP